MLAFKAYPVQNPHQFGQFNTILSYALRTYSNTAHQLRPVSHKCYQNLRVSQPKLCIFSSFITPTLYVRTFYAIILTALRYLHLHTSKHIKIHTYISLHNSPFSDQCMDRQFMCYTRVSLRLFWILNGSLILKN